MSTTHKATGTRRAVKAAIAREETLEQFSAYLDDYLNRDAGFADYVRDLFYVRKQLAMVAARREELFALVKVDYNHGVRTVAGPGGGGYALRMTTPTEVLTRRTVPSKAVEKHDRGLWLRCKTAVPYVSVSVPIGAAVGEVTLPRSMVLPVVPGPAATTTEIIEAYRAVPSVASLREIENDTVASLEKIGADGGWDGLPLTFSDGWTAGLRRMQYSADRLAEIAPDVFDRLAVTTTTGGTQTLYIAELTPQAVAEGGDGYSE